MIYYVTTVAGTVPIGESQAAIAARAVNRGIDGNIAAYKILQLISRITGITAVENQLEYQLIASTWSGRLGQRQT